MDGRTFAKLAKDTKLLDKKLSITDVDLIFASVKQKAERRISYAQFLMGLRLLAQKKEVQVKTLENNVIASKGPKLRGTKC